MKKSDHITIEPISIAGYEQVLHVKSSSSILEAIIAIHSTTLGPALGGIRARTYTDFDHALQDALRLAKGMTYKNAIAQIGFGGGKSVILLQPNQKINPQLLQDFARAVDSLEGQYICAQDAGISSADLVEIEAITPYVVGVAGSKGCNDPSPSTAHGTFLGIQVVLQELYGSPSCKGKTIAIQGLGNVGAALAQLLFWAGADLMISDIDPARAALIAKQTGAQSLSPEEILQAPCHILAPCALGGIFNAQTIPQLKCQGIAGSANNQLDQEVVHATMLAQQGILYATDFVINGGGVAHVSTDLDKGGFNPQRARDRVLAIEEHLQVMFTIAKQKSVTPYQAALDLAKYRLKYGIGKRATPIFTATID